ncbi:CAP domain-containing protein [Rhizobiaceae bacterium n13]|uniref:CAP domain-containing protein n=1 Tax=Ferirhizobium litorale TaxID=2927786 RepID=A0AAE3QF92_9HYPH|nr:CAP domain-containing protein [Fererhizobium litorale]MDI7862281.1 CAP domain-containing protein [Fererhizobium litorale]MDI7922445.1 CAP domain-containing protein [Fererhizobium litorale]
MNDETLFHPGRRLFLQSSAIALLAGIAGCTTFSDIDTSGGTGEDRSSGALAMVNDLRTKHGRTALVIDPAASRAAQQQARRMAKAGKMQHLIGLNDDFGSRMKANGVALPASENIAVGQDATAEAVTAWINSPRHLTNMLGNYRGIGVAVAQNPASGNRPYWAMVLSS